MPLLKDLLVRFDPLTLSSMQRMIGSKEPTEAEYINLIRKSLALYDVLYHLQHDHKVTIVTGEKPVTGKTFEILSLE